MLADLHCHSTLSDGSCMPRELIALAKRARLSHLSITDHDNIEAYPEVREFAAQEGITLFPGVELSTLHKEWSVHVLGYCFQPTLGELCKAQAVLRKKRAEEMIERLQALHLPIEVEKSISTIGRPHLAQAMVKAGFVANTQEAFDRFLAMGKPAYIRVPFVSTKEAIAAIQQAGGVAVLAHPHLLPSAAREEVCSLPFDGIECYYARMPARRNQTWVLFAKQRNLLITGGSDFHGKAKPLIALGSSTAPEKTIERLHELL